MKKLDPNHIVAILSLRVGDLFLTKENAHGRPPVIGFFDYIDGVKSVVKYNSTSAYFMPIEEGTVGIYFRNNVLSVKSNYWAKFHEVWIEGRKCVIHEHFIDPLPKSKGKDNG